MAATSTESESSDESRKRGRGTRWGRSVLQGRSRSPLKIDISDDEGDNPKGSNDKGNSKSSGKGNDKGNNKNKTNGPPACINRAHPEGCPGLMPACQKELIGDLAAWRAHIVEKIQKRNEAAAAAAAPCEDTQLEIEPQS